MDNPTTESSNTPLNTNEAASLFATMLDPEPPKEEAAPVEAEAVQAEPDAPAEEVNAEADDPVVTIKIDGKDVQVPLSELKNGYQRQADYTRKTMEVSETRKAAEAEIQKAQAERQNYAANLGRMQAQLEGALQEQHKTTDWEALLQSDPVEYLRQQHLSQQRQAQLQQVYAAQQQVHTQLQAEQQAQIRNQLQTQHQALLDKLPQWRDESKAKAERAALREYLAQEGYDTAAIDSIGDAKAVVLARKAMLYDQMMSKAQLAQKKVSTAPSKVERPGQGDNPGIDRRTSAFQRLSKSGRAEDAAAIFATLL